MFNPDEELAKELEDKTIDFALNLRLGDGFSVEKFKLMCEIFRRCAKQWKDLDTVPKRVAWLFVDLTSVIQGTAGYYEEDEGKLVMWAADYVTELARLCLKETGDKG